MADVHDRVLEVLRHWQREKRATDDPHRLFYLRQRRDARFRKGYWFPGDDNTYLCVSFWQGGDSLHHTPTAYLEIHRTRGCRGILTARDSLTKQQVFAAFVDEVKDGLKPGYKKTRLKGQWEKSLSLHFEDFETCLNAYLRQDKRRIDALLEKQSGQVIGDEFEQPLSFLKEEEFNESLQRVLEERDTLKARSTKTKGAHTISFGIRPGTDICLSRFTISDFQGIRLAEATNLEGRWIFLTGDNGFGKTSVLRALALALGDEVGLPVQWGPETVLEVTAWYVDESRVIRKTTKDQAGTDNPFGPYVVGYGPGRLIAQPVGAQNRADGAPGHVDGLFAHALPLKSFDYELEQASKYNTDQFGFLIDAIRTTTDGKIAGIEVDAKGVVWYLERLEAAEDSTTAASTARTRYDNLATGLRSLINLVADIYVRLAAAQEGRSPRELLGIVFIDELENHLHPKLQRVLPAKLSEVFPRVQFVASTHSPIPFLGAPEDSVFLRVRRDATTDITVERVELGVKIATLLPDAILSSPLFGFEQQVSVWLPDIRDINPAPTYAEALVLAELAAAYPAAPPSTPTQ